MPKDENRIAVAETDLSCAETHEATLHLLNAYAMDPMGDGKPLSETARRDLIPGLQKHPTTMVFLAYRGGEAVGLAICFRGFSTFAARPIVNISDYFVLPVYRGTGIGRMLLAAIEERGANRLLQNHARSAREQPPSTSGLCRRRILASRLCARGGARSRFPSRCNAWRGSDRAFYFSAASTRCFFKKSSVLRLAHFSGVGLEGKKLRPRRSSRPTSS